MSVQRLSSTELACEHQVLCSELGVQDLTKRLGWVGGGELGRVAQWEDEASVQTKSEIKR